MEEISILLILSLSLLMSGSGSRRWGMVETSLIGAQLKHHFPRVAGIIPIKILEARYLRR